jgi:hypothetical protein
MAKYEIDYSEEVSDGDDGFVYLNHPALNAGEKAAQEAQKLHPSHLARKAYEGYVEPPLSWVSKMMDWDRALTGGPIVGSALEGMYGGRAYDREEFNNAVNPGKTATFPDSSTMMERVGVKRRGLSDVIDGYAEPGQGEHWYSPEKGGLADPSIRGAGGVALDALSSPTTYLSLGSAPLIKGASNLIGPAAKYAEYLLNTYSKAATSQGSKMYAKGVRPILEAAEKSGHSGTLDELLAAGIKGSPKQISEGINRRKQELFQEMHRVISEADDAGATGNIKHASKYFRDLLDTYTNSNTNMRLTDKQRGQIENEMLSLFNEYRSKHGKHAPLSQLLQFRKDSDVSNKIGDIIGKDRGHPIENSLVMAYREGLNDEIDKNLVNYVGQSGSDAYRANNLKYHALAGSEIEDAAKKMVADKKPFIRVDLTDIPVVIGGAATGSMFNHAGEAAAGLLATKKAAEALASTRFRTQAGHSLWRSGQGKTGKVLDVVTRQAAQEGTDIDPGAWDLLKKEEEKKEKKGKK